MFLTSHIFGRLHGFSLLQETPECVAALQSQLEPRPGE